MTTPDDTEVIPFSDQIQEALVKAAELSVEERESLFISLMESFAQLGLEPDITKMMLRSYRAFQTLDVDLSKLTLSRDESRYLESAYGRERPIKEKEKRKEESNRENLSQRIRKQFGDLNDFNFEIKQFLRTNQDVIKAFEIVGASSVNGLLQYLREVQGIRIGEHRLRSVLQTLFSYGFLKMVKIKTNYPKPAHVYYDPGHPLIDQILKRKKEFYSTEAGLLEDEPIENHHNHEDPVVQRKIACICGEQLLDRKSLRIHVRNCETFMEGRS